VSPTLTTSKLVVSKGRGVVASPRSGLATTPLPLRAGLSPTSVTGTTGKRKSSEQLLLDL